MVPVSTPVLTERQTKRIAITSPAQAEYLVRALLATEALLGRERDPDVDQWVRVTRVTLLELFSEPQARAILRTADALAHRIDLER